MSQAHNYRIQPSNPKAHLFKVELTIEQPDANGQLLRLPTWIPGSYMIRDFAKNIVTLSAEANGKTIASKKIDKSTWQLEPVDAKVTVTYEVYAWDLSVRSAHLDQTHGYFNGTSVFLEVCNQADNACSVEIIAPEGDLYKNWRVATSLALDGAELYGFGRYRADNYDDLIDHPVELADFTLATFEACGVPHDVVLSGKHFADMDRLCRDLKKICELHINFFGQPAPMERYVFMTLVVGDGYGGLEHRASTSLICNRGDLPHAKDGEKVTDGYRTYLGLCSHEYFHTWNVKRIKPAKFTPFDLSQEVHTELLWAFEGITSYYDDLGVYRSGLIPKTSYLELLSQVISRVHKGSGRTKQSVTASSFDTWTKFYKQDENAVNAIVSYYTKGSLVALALDLTLRKLSANKVSLNQLMKKLWQNYQATGKGIGETEIQELASELAAQDLGDFFQQALYSCEDLPLAELLAHFGVDLKWRAEDTATDFGGKPASQDCPTPYLGTRMKGNEIALVIEDSPAQTAGLSAGDTLIAVGGLKLKSGELNKALMNYMPNESVTIHAFRRDELMTFEVKLGSAPTNTCELLITDEEKASQWLDDH